MYKILVIDDEKAILDNLKLILTTAGYHVVTACTGEEGLALLLTQSDFDCVVCDMKMHSLTGTEVTKAIREMDSDIGIIILIEYGDMENAINAMKEGAFDYLNKPVYSDKLMVSIENAIKKLNLLRENRQLNEDLIRRNLYFQHINDSAQRILLNMVPRSCPKFEKLDTSAVYKSCECVGGDMYDIFQLGDKIFFYLLDVCGHGILSAVMTMMMKASFQNIKLFYEHAGKIPDIDKVIHELNREMVKNTSSYLFVTLFAGALDLHTGEISYVSAGHIDQYVQTKKGIVPLPSTNTVIGLFEDATFESKSIYIEPGDRIFLFTDGITEIWNEEVIMATDRMQEIITENTDHPIKDVLKAMYNSILDLYEDKKPDDDITIIGMELLPQPADCGGITKCN